MTTKIKASSFGVRFYRRAMPKVNVPLKNAAQDNAREMTLDIPEQEIPSPPPSYRRENIGGSCRSVFNPLAKKGFPYRIFHGVSCAVARYRLSFKPVAAQIFAPSQVPVKERKKMVGANEQALWAAAYNGDCSMIRMLVMEGVDIDARDGEGRTAINIATQYGRRDALKTLLAAKEMRHLATLGKLPDTSFFRKFKQEKAG